MKFALLTAVAATALVCVAPTPLQAQATDTAAEIAAMRAQMEALAKRIDQLEGELAKAQTTDATIPANGATTAVTPRDSAPKPDEIAWKGAPEFSTDSRFSFKPRGRIQIDAGAISSPEGIADDSTGFGSEVRRAYLGVEGKLPGGFGYRAEVDVATSEVEITDLYITYAPSKALTLMVGQSKPFWGLEEVTSDLFTSFTERAAFNSAFGFERRLGASASWTSGAVLVQGGVFTDNVADLNDDANNALSYDGRVVFMPKLAGGQLHLGGSAHFRELNDAAASVRYRARPFIHTPDIRFVDTAAIPASSETGYALEAAYIAGPFHATGEAHWQKVDRVGGADPSFFGGYAEVGYFLTDGDSRGYKSGVFDRIVPENAVGEGGIGAVQVNLRYDMLDLADQGILGGQQDTYAVGLVWVPTANTKLMASYGHIEYSDAAIATVTGQRDYSVDAFGVRAQLDF